MRAYWTLTRRELAGFLLSLGGYMSLAFNRAASATRSPVS